METVQKIVFGFLGNGITAWTSCVGNGKTDPDYQAHISPNRKITYYQDQPPQYFKDAVEKAAQSNFVVGNTESSFAFLPKSKPTKYVDTKFCGRIILCEEYVDGVKHLCTPEGHIYDRFEHLCEDYDPDDKTPVYLVGNLKRNNYGQIYGAKFGYSYSKEVADAACEAIRKWISPCWREAVVEEGTQDYILSQYCSMMNLDYPD